MSLIVVLPSLQSHLSKTQSGRGFALLMSRALNIYKAALSCFHDAYFLSQKVKSGFKYSLDSKVTLS